MQKKALVVGLGVSGKSALMFLKHLGFEVVCFDVKESLGLFEGSLVFSSIEPLLNFSFSLVVLSPGVSLEHPLVQHFLLQGVEVIGEAELAFSHFKGKAVAITGTNGKTTVTLLVEHVLKTSGRKAKALGNVGEPLAECLLREDPEEIIVAELSSYQLETLKTPVFTAAVILNITPDHLDRYQNMLAYASAKARLQHCVAEGGAFYVFEEVIDEFSELFSTSFYSIGTRNSSFLQVEEHVICSLGEPIFTLPCEYKKLGKHDRLNALAAWALCSCLGVTQDEFLFALKSFKKPAHRIEFVATIDGVDFYDDSKGTNVDAVIKSVLTMKGPVVLIAGGVDKGSSYLPWKDSFKDKVKAIFVLGEASKKIEKELSLFFNVKIVDSLGEAVQKAKELACEGDSVLLSPGCSSFDMFRDYAHRGNEFQKFVREGKG